MVIRIYFIVILFLGFSITMFSQQWTATEGHFKIVHHQDSTLLIPTRAAQQKIVACRAHDAAGIDRHTAIGVVKNNIITLFGMPRGRVIAAEITMVYEGDTTIEKVTFATRSRSTGEMKVYFNHSVNVSVSQIQNAVNINNKIPDTLAAYINRCEETLDIAIYNATDITLTAPVISAINAAHNRGVRVRIVYESTSTNSLLNALNPAIATLPGTTGFAYGLMHNKFVVFDANHSDPNKPYILTGSTNWTTAQLSGTDLNNVIIIQDQALALAYQIEFEEMWGSNGNLPNASNAKFGPDKTDNTPHNFNINGVPVELYFSPSDGTNQRIIDNILFATHDVNVATMLITRSDIRQAITTKYDSGIQKTHVTLSTQNPTGNEFPAIQSHLPAGQAMQYTASGTLHHKFMVVDNDPSSAAPRVLTGSHNWSTSAETRNDENTLIIHDRNIANQYYQAFSWMHKNVGGGFNSVPKEEKTNVLIYPNPAAEILYISNVVGEFSVLVYDATGREILTSNFAQEAQLNLSNLSSGVYVIHVKTESNLLQSVFIKD